MSKDANARVWVFAVAAAGLCGYLDYHSDLMIRFVPSVALLLSSMLLTDAMEVRRTGICPMRNQPAIVRESDATGFRTQLQVQYATVIVILGIAIGSQIDIAVA
jgi:hypothetical protein